MSDQTSQSVSRQMLLDLGVLTIGVFALSALIFGVAGYSRKATESTTPYVANSLCDNWFADRPLFRANRPGEFEQYNDVACFDGIVGPPGESRATRDLLEWAKKAEDMKDPHLVIRSMGGDAKTALLLGERFQDARVAVVAHGICASSCAAFIFAGQADHHLSPGDLLLFDGGYTVKSIDRSLAQFDARVAKQTSRDNRAEIESRKLRKSLESLKKRQDELLLKADVDPDLLHNSDMADLSSLRDELCGNRPKSSREFYYLSFKDLTRFGFSKENVFMIPDSDRVNALLANYIEGVAACRVDFER